MNTRRQTNRPKVLQPVTFWFLASGTAYFLIAGAINAIALYQRLRILAG